MRTIITIPNEQAKYIDAICQAEHISRAEFIRRALEAHLKELQDLSSHLNAFGLFKSNPIDSLSYQNKIRSEWE